MNSDGNPFTGLAQAVGKTLSVVAIGFLLGTLRICDPAAGRGLTQYLTWVAFPALVFHGLSTMDLSKLSWTVFSAILMSKIIPMVVMVIIVMLTSRAKMGDRLKKAGILGMFVTMTNDVAIGLPIVEAVYPDFVSYLYLPQQYVIFNPLAFILLELGAAYDSDGPVTDPDRKSPSVAWKIIRNVLTNHVLVVSVIGIAFNIIFHGKIPTFLEETTKFIGQSFPPGAIFSIGLSMVGKSQVLQGKGLIWPAVITIVKVGFVANIGRYYAVLVAPHWEEFHNFLYVYGCLPVGVPCFLFAIQYDAFPEIISGGIILALLFSGPAIALAVVFSDLTDSMGSLLTIEEVLNGISGAALFALIIVLVGRKVYAEISEGLLLHLVVSTLASCIGYQLCASLFCPTASIKTRIPIPYLVHQFFRQQVEVMYVAVAVCLWTQLTRGQSQARKLLHYFLLFAWVIPFGFTALLTLADAVQAHDLSCWISYGLFQIVTELCILSIELAIVFFCFVSVLRPHHDESSVAPMTEEGQQSFRNGHVFRVCLLMAFFLLFALFKLIWLSFSAFQAPEREPVELLQKLLVALLTHCHGLVQFLVLGLFCEDSQQWATEMLDRTRRTIRRWVYSTEPVVPQHLERIDEQLLALFDEMVAPQTGLVANRFWGIRTYFHVMQGSDIVDWMVKAGKAVDRAQAVAFGQTLLQAGLIYHVTLEHNFHDKPLFYHANMEARVHHSRPRLYSAFEDVMEDMPATSSFAILASAMEAALRDE